MWSTYSHQTFWSTFAICSKYSTFDHQYSVVINHKNLHSLAYIWPSVKSGLLSLFKVCPSIVWSSITISTVWPIFGHLYSLVFYHNLYSLAYIWPSEQSGILSQSIQSVLYLAISIVWSSITISTVCSIFGHQYSLVF